MDYVFGPEYFDGADIETVKTVGSEHTDLTGTVTVVRKYTDSDITDTFKVVRKIRTAEDVEGRRYDWYEIRGHYRYIDYYNPAKPFIEGAREENENSIFDLADLEDENSNFIFELAEYVAELEARIEALEGGN